MIINKKLESIPFDKLYQIYEEAASAAVEGLEQHYQQAHNVEVAKLEKAYSDSHEAPSEVSFSSQVEVKAFDKAEVRRKAGQKAVIDIWMPRYNLGSILVSIIPQALAYITSKPFRFAEVLAAGDSKNFQNLDSSKNFQNLDSSKNISAESPNSLGAKIAAVEGQIDSSKLIKKAFNFSSEWDRGLYIFLMLDSRSSYLTTQYKGEGLQFCSLVPLIPYAFRMHHKIPYSKWDRDSLKWSVNKSLADAMLHEGQYTREDLLAARELGLVYQTGPKAGETRNPVSCFKLWSTKGGCLQGVPPLAQVMYTQIWCAHPSNRTPYMVLDPSNWDVMPPPLVSTENIFSPIKSNNVSTGGSDLPWI